MWKRFKTLFIEQLTQGVSPKSLALSVAITLVISTFPIAGTTWIILGILAATLRLNQPLVQGLNQLMTPLWLLMLPVYLRVGEWLLGATPVSINPAVILAQIQIDWRMALASYTLAAIHASLAWLVIAPGMVFIIYRITRPLFSKLARRFATRQKI